MPWDATSPLTEVYRKLIALRRSHPALTRGDFETLEARGMLLRYARTWQGERVEIAVNPGLQPVPCVAAGEILLQKNFAGGSLLPEGYVVAVKNQRS